MGEAIESKGRGLAKPIVVGWLLVIVFVGVCANLVDYRHHLRIFQLAWMVGFVGFGLIVYALHEIETSRLGSWPMWFLGIVLIRVALLHTVPSDDLHRYVWEGKIQRHGLNPYVTIPANTNDPILIREDPNWPRINHPDYPAIYPPLSQLMFRLTSAISDSVLVVKAFIVLFELMAIHLLGQLLVRIGRAPHWASIFALCPLTITSFAIEGHQDTLMLCALAAAGLASSRDRLWFCAVLLGAAISAKTVAVVLMPWIAFRKPLAVPVTFAVVVACYLPFADAGWHVFDSLLRFGDSTTSLGAIVTLLDSWVGDRTARIIAATIVATYAIVLAIKRLELPKYATRIFAALVLALPVVHAWYLTWFLFFAWSRVRWAWIVLCWAAVVYFEADGNRAQTGEWVMPAWVFAAWFSPFALAWIVERYLGFDKS